MSKLTALRAPLRRERPLSERLLQRASLGVRERFSRAIKAFRGESFTLYDDQAVQAFGGAAGGRFFLDWIKGCTSPDEDYKRSAQKLRARARDLERNNAYIRQFLSLLACNVIGPKGISFDGAVRANGSPDGELDEKANKALGRAWYAWHDSPVTVDGRMNMLELQHLLVRTVARDGEVFVRKHVNFPHSPFRFALEPIDADMIDEGMNRKPSEGVNEVRLGIEVDKYGRPLWYHVGKPLYALDREETTKRIPADQIIHLQHPDRVQQTRSVSWLAPTMPAIKMLQGYCEAELVAARTASAKMGFFVTKGAGGEGAALAAGDPITMDASPGTLEVLAPGQEFMPWDPQHPSTAFPDFVKAILRQIATGLGVSYNALANDLEGVNYSSIRHGLQGERDLWRLLQEWWICSFLDPVYRSWIQAATLTPLLELPAPDSPPSTYFPCVWTPRGYPYVDPLNDAKADELELSLGLTSRTRILGAQGEDLSDTFEQLANEKKAAKKAGIEISGSEPAKPASTGGAGQAGEEPGSSNGNGNKAQGGGRLASAFDHDVMTPLRG